MVLDTNTQTPWRIAVVPATKVRVTGTATADALRSGLIVEFTAETDGHEAIPQKVGELTITSLTPQKQIGLFPPDELGAGDGQGGLGESNGNGAKADNRAEHAAARASVRQPPASTALWGG